VGATNQVRPKQGIKQMVRRKLAPAGGNNTGFNEKKSFQVFTRPGLSYRDGICTTGLLEKLISGIYGTKICSSHAPKSKNTKREKAILLRL